MSRTQFGPGRKGRLSKLLRNLYYCQTRHTPIPTPPIPTIPFSGSGFTYTFENNTYLVYLHLQIHLDIHDNSRMLYMLDRQYKLVLEVMLHLML